MSDTFASLLQVSISPIVLISAASLLLLSITNRFGRTIDRSRLLVRELDAPGGYPFAADHKRQLRILLRRSQYLRSAVLSIAASIFLSALMIISVFLLLFLGWNLKPAILGFFFCSILLLCVAVACLFRDVSVGLSALRLEVGRHLEKGS